ncbi:unnamed protein product [Trifolium pratense]|uniref:Uncharacterized protein n=1 Tax=Trifolium pratense TaxID=57577 RepID=A0ACB0IWI6_TRIPR|nr:unnamed protein product [Trifolium pratense]
MEEINNTPMNVAADSNWLSDLEMVDEYILFDEDCNLNLLDANQEQFLSHDIASAFEEQRQTLQQCLTTEFISTTMSKIFTDETSFESFDDFDFEKLAKELKTIDQSNNAENFSPQFSASTPSIQSPQILSFDNPNPTEFYSFDQTQNEMVTSLSLPELGNIQFSTQISKASSKNQNLETKTSQSKRPRAHGLDHIMAERKRRENLSKSFIALAALVPGLKKMDKASILADTIKYLKELKERLAVLEEPGKKTNEDQSMVVTTKPDVCSDQHYSSSHENTETESAADGIATGQSLFKVEAKVKGKDMLIRIHCQKYDGLLVKIITEIQSYQLSVVNNSVLAFGDSILDITIIAEIGEGYNLSIKGLVKHLSIAALEFMSS